MTLRQAVTSLVEEGILTRYVGSGTFVASDRVREKMRGTTSFTEIIQNLGKTPSSKVLSYQKTKANEVECDKLHLKKALKLSVWSEFVMQMSCRFVTKWRVFRIV
jgi:GntR family transcriptional regulator